MIFFGWGASDARDPGQKRVRPPSLAGDRRAPVGEQAIAFAQDVPRVLVEVQRLAEPWRTSLSIRR